MPVRVLTGDVRPHGTGHGLRQPEFVGRQDELAALREALARPPAIILLDGEAGVGKSRLVRELLAGAKGVLVARCPPVRESLTLSPLVDALRQATDSVAGLALSPLAGALRPVFPEWAADLPPAPERLDDAAAARHRLFRALAELLDRLEVRVLVVEDVHWADEVTVHFLMSLAGRADPPSLLLTFRAEELAADSAVRRLPARAPAGATALRLTVEPLDAAATGEMISSMLGGSAVSESFATFLHEQSGGIPLAVEELVWLMREREDVASYQGEWIRRDISEIRVPPTIRDAVLERASRLGEDGRAVLAAAAILGEPADEEILVEVTGLPLDRLRGALAEALGSGLLHEEADRRAAFRHVLNRGAIEESVPAPLRRTLHHRAARALERRTPRQVARLARHYREAADRDNWCRCAEEAAELAVAAGDEVTAARTLYDLLTGVALPAETVIRLVTKVPLASLTGSERLQNLIDVLRRSLDEPAVRAGDAHTRARIRVQIALLYIYGYEYRQGLAEMERVLPLLRDDPELTNRALMYMWLPGAEGWPMARRRRWLRCTAGLAARLAPADRSTIVTNSALMRLSMGDRAGWAVAAPERDEHRSGSDITQPEIIRKYGNLGDIALRWGLYRDAERYLATALRIASDERYPRYHQIVYATRLHLDLLTGAWQGLAEKIQALLDDDELPMVSRLELGMVRDLLDAATGSPGSVADRLRSVVAELVRRGVFDVGMEVAAALGRLYLADGRVGDALEVTEGLVATAAAGQMWLSAGDLAPVRVAALVAAGRVTDAAELQTRFAEGLRGGGTPVSLAGLATCRAVLTEARGEHRRAAAAFARAAAAWQRLPRPYDALLARERQAHCLLAAGDRDRALALLSEVGHDLAELGARRDASRVTQVLRGHGMNVPPRTWRGGRHGYGDELSPRERDVVRLLPGGRTNREIAEVLYLSPKTVARHLSSAMRKLGATSRTALAVWAVQTGLADEPGPDVTSA